MFVDLILTVCMISDLKTCAEQHLLFESRGSLSQCMFLAQPQIAEWSGTHPEWKVIKWRCANPDAEGKPI